MIIEILLIILVTELITIHALITWWKYTDLLNELRGGSNNDT